MSCIFNVNDLDNSLEQFRDSLYERLSRIPDYGLTNIEDIKQEILRQVSEVSESFLINPENVDSSFSVFDDESLFWDIESYISEEEDFAKVIPSESEFKEAMVSWQKENSKETEDTSTSRLDNANKNIKRIKDDPLAFAYGRALKARIRAKQHANTVGVNSILYNSDGIINSVEDLNSAIVNLQEKLLKNILNYLETKGIHVYGKMYINGEYTGIIEDIASRYDKYFKFDFNELNNLYNNKEFEILDAISSWVILNNFDTILELTFGKALNIDPDKSKYSSNKYSIAGGSNVYTTWRTNEEIDLSKEINNISLAIITSIPYYIANSTSPKNDRNLKFNEFIYLISKIKDIPHYLKGDYVFEIEDDIKISEEAKEKLNGKSLSSVINTLRDNPLEMLPIVIEAFNNKILFDRIKANLQSNYFASVDRDLINTVYQGIFNLDNPNSLYSIQTKSGFLGNNYYAFIAQTIDSTFKSGFLLYFRNPEGEIYVRKMYDQSIYNIELGIKSDINNFNSLISLDTYNVSDNAEEINYLDLQPSINRFTINKLNYEVLIYLNLNKKDVKIVDSSGKEVTDSNILDEIKAFMKAKYGKPTIVTFTYDKYHKGPLKVDINLIDGKINYSVNGILEKFLSRADFESLLPLIDDTLKLNFGIDINYFNAFLDRVNLDLNISAYPKVAKDLMLLVSRVISNKYLLETYIKYIPVNLRKNKIDSIFTNGGSYKPTYNRRLNELNYLTDSETNIITNLAEAKALVTGRLTSSQILDGEGNPLASSTLSRLVNTLDYLVEALVKQPDSASKEFTLWKPGVYKGVFQLKEMRDNSKGSSKPHTRFSSKEMENSLVFIDFVLGLMNIQSTKTPYTDGVVGFYSSENSDKTYVGRLLIDLLSIKVGETTLYNLLRENPENINIYAPVIRQELGNFYIKALKNINKEWARIGLELGIDISYGKWDELYLLVDLYNSQNGTNLTPVQYLKLLVTDYNFNNPFNSITLIENVHYVDNKGSLIRNDSFVANYYRFSSDENFDYFMKGLEFEVLHNLLKDKLSVDATPELETLLGKEWIDPATNKIILAKYQDTSTGKFINVRRLRDLRNVSNLKLNPLISAYNYLNYFFILEYMNSSVGAYYAHPNKKNVDSYLKYKDKEISWEQALTLFLLDEKVRKLALDKRNVSFTASMHSMLKNLILGIPDQINVALMPDVKDQFETISGDLEELKPFDGATFTNPFYQVLLNYSLGGAKVGVIKKTFTHYYDEKTGTGGIIKTAEFPLTNEYIRRSKFYQIMMKNMTDRVWRDKNGNPCIVDITTDYEGNSIIFSNPESDLGYMYYLDDVTGDYYRFDIIKGESPNTYIRTIQKVDLNGLPTLDEPKSETWEVTTNYDLWRMFGGERSMSFSKGRFSQSEHSISLVVTIMNRTTTYEEDENGQRKVLSNVKTQLDVWLPLKHSDIHLMPTSGAVKLGAANVNSEDAYKTADSSKINHYRIRTNQVGVLLDKEHLADGEDLSIMTLVLSACAARGYTQEMTLNLYNAMAKLAEAGIRPYLDNFKQFFKISERPNATPELLEEARLRFENTLLDTLIKALANSTNTSSTLQIITLELLEKAKEGKDIDFAKLNVPLSDPAVMRKLHSTISVALTKAAIKIKVDGSLNILCPSFGIVKVYNGKMYEDYLNDLKITDELNLLDSSPLYNLIDSPHKLKLGRTYKLIRKDGAIELKTLKNPSDYYELKESLNNYDLVRELFAPFLHTVVRSPEIPSPEEIRDELDRHKSFSKKVLVALKYGINIDTNLEPRNFEEYVYSNIPPLIILDLARNTTGKNVDFKKLNFLFRTKENGGLTVELAAHLLWEERPNFLENYDTVDFRNAILDVMTSIEVPSDLTRFIEDNRINEALEEYSNSYKEEAYWLLEHPEVSYFEGGRELGSYNVTFSGAILALDLSVIIVTGNPATTKLTALKMGGIDALRHPDKNGMHFGNPFTHLEKEVKNKRASVLLPTVRESSQAFELWLDGTAYQDVEPERRLWILDQINNGSLFGRPIIYYTTTIKDSEGVHYYNPETFPNHALILLKKINLKQKELAGPLFLEALQVTKSFNLYDLVSVRNLHELKSRELYTDEELEAALKDLLKDLNILHSRHGLVVTDSGIVEIDPSSIEIEPYEIVLPKIFATVFGLTENDNLNDIKKDPQFFLRRLILNLNPQHSDYTICLLRINGKHVYVLNSDDAVQTQYFRPKEILKTRENNKLYRQLNDELLYELNETDLVWERINPDGTVTEVIVTDNPLNYLDRVDYITLNLNRKNSEKYNQNIILNLRKSKNKNVRRYIETFDYVMSNVGKTFDEALKDIQEINLNTYRESPVGKFYEELGNEIYASFLKSLEIVAARIPALSMLSFMPMKVVGFEKSDRNTAYVSTTQFLFLGSDLDIDAVSLASYAFDKSGRYIIHSPLANITSYELLKASENLPFPTGIELDINPDEQFDYSILFSENGPFILERGNRVRINNKSTEAIKNLALFINYCNEKGFIPTSTDPSLSLAINSIRAYINRHNNYINTSKDVEEFSKNYVVSSMYNIGISPANLVESQQALDSITKPLKDVAEHTLKALQQISNDNPADYTTNIRGFVQNMDGKTGVGICAVGLKGFFAATARYNEVLNGGNPEEIKRLKSDVVIAGEKFRMLANAYTTNEVSLAILGEIITQLNQGKDAALILSALLSLATDNAKELTLSKLNAANMLGMYIYGIAIGMDFENIAKIIASKTGQVIDGLIKDDVILGQRGMNMENIFDYLELGPKLNHSEKASQDIESMYNSLLSQKTLRDLAWERAYFTKDGLLLYVREGEFIELLKSLDPSIITGEKLIDFYELKKRLNITKQNIYYDGVIEFNRNIENAQEYILNVLDIITDFNDFNTSRGKIRLSYNGEINSGIYGDFKKLYLGGEEMRRLGLLLHINQGNETSYALALIYIDRVESTISSAQYRNYREYARKLKLKGEKSPKDYSKQYEFNLHKFVSNYYYREGCIDLYGGICNEELFRTNKDYREMFIKALNPKGTNAEEQYTDIVNKLKISTSKTFFNILDILKVPHYFLYLTSADMLHLYMLNSIKYRALYELGKVAINEIGAFSANDREAIFRRTELFIDRILRDRFFISKEITFEIPVGKDLFVREGNTIKRLPVTDFSATIKLGTREGNASFKLLMEETIIPELKKMDRFRENKFIQSLGTVLFLFNPELQTIRCIAPNINMSPRSDTDSALFEEVKHDFNSLRTSDYTYVSGGIKHSLIDLFYYYNLIAFGGRVGENTLTNIFQDVLDYGNIKSFRDYEAFLDKFGELSLNKPTVKGSVSLSTLIRETAPRAIESSTKLNYFYSDNWRTGELSFNSRNPFRTGEDPDTGRKITLPKYSSSPVSFTSEEDSKDFLVNSSDTDIATARFSLSGGLQVIITLQKGSITDINIDGISIEIPLKDKPFFRNLKTISKITPEGILEKYYNKKLIMSKIEEIISC